MNPKDNSSPDTPSNDSGTKVGRRRLVKALGAGASGVIVSQWSKPIVDSVIVPLHAQAPPPPPPPGCPATFSYNGPEQPFVIVPDTSEGALQFVRDNVHPLLQQRSTFNPTGTMFRARADWAAVLMRAGSQWLIFLNVMTDQFLVQDRILDEFGEPLEIDLLRKYSCIESD